MQELSAYRAAQGVTPEYLEAFSWLARAEFESHNYAAAEKYSQGIYAQSTEHVEETPARPRAASPAGARRRHRSQDGNLLAAARPPQRSGRLTFRSSRRPSAQLRS